MFSVCVCARVELPVAPTNSNSLNPPVANSAPDCTRHIHPHGIRLLLRDMQSVPQSLFRPLDSCFAYHHLLNCVHIVRLNGRMIKNYEFERQEKETMARYFKAYTCIQSVLTN